MPERSSVTEKGDRPAHIIGVRVPQQHALETAARSRQQVHTAPEESRQESRYRPVGTTSLRACGHPNANARSVPTDDFVPRSTRGHQHVKGHSARMVPDQVMQRRSAVIGQEAPPSWNPSIESCSPVDLNDDPSRAPSNRNGRRAGRPPTAESGELPANGEDRWKWLARPVLAFPSRNGAAFTRWVKTYPVANDVGDVACCRGCVWKTWRVRASTIPDTTRWWQRSNFPA